MNINAKDGISSTYFSHILLWTHMPVFQSILNKNHKNSSAIIELCFVLQILLFGLSVSVSVQTPNQTWQNRDQILMSMEIIPSEHINKCWQLKLRALLLCSQVLCTSSIDTFVNKSISIIGFSHFWMPLKFFGIVCSALWNGPIHFGRHLFNANKSTKYT